MHRACIFYTSLLHHSRIDLPYSTVILLHFLIRVLFRKFFSHKVVRIDHFLNVYYRRVVSYERFEMVYSMKDPPVANADSNIHTPK